MKLNIGENIKNLRKTKNITQEELAAVILEVAAGQKDYEGLLAWLLDHQA